MRLMVGITQLLPEWEIIIQQIGVPYKIISLTKSFSSDQYSIIIVTKRETKIKKDILLHYINSGGSILTDADIAEWLFGIDTFLAFVDFIESDDPIFNGVLPGFIQTKLLLPQRANMLKSGSGKRLAQIYTSEKGTAVILPGGFSNMILDTRIKRRNFPTRESNLPSERVARISKHTIREVVQKSLEHLHFIRGLPF